MLATSAQGVAQRAFVHSPPLGNDANAASNCSLALPCRTFDVAIGVTQAGGEVVILDTAGYGAMTISQSLKVVAPAGVYGGISVFGTGNGVTINAGDTDVVTLRGLDITGLPAPETPTFGIQIANAGTVHIEKASISNFTQETSACINLVSAKRISVAISDSFLRECRSGIFADGTGLDATTRLQFAVDNTQIAHGLNTSGNGSIAINVQDGVVLTVRNSLIGGGGDGIYMKSTNPGAGTIVQIVGTEITRMVKGIETDGNQGLQLHVMSSQLWGNANAALLHRRGSVFLTHSVVATNTNSLVDCGAGPGSVFSLAFDASTGSNAIYGNAELGAAGVGPGCTAYITPTIIVGK